MSLDPRDFPGPFAKIADFVPTTSASARAARQFDPIPEGSCHYEVGKRCNLRQLRELYGLAAIELQLPLFDECVIALDKIRGVHAAGLSCGLDFQGGVQG